jgi:hypothetical protein
MRYISLMLLGSILVPMALCDLKAAILTDIHINTGYFPNITLDTFCENKTTGVKYTDQVAHLGRQGCDPPIELLEKILLKMS